MKTSGGIPCFVASAMAAFLALTASASAAEPVVQGTAAVTNYVQLSSMMAPVVDRGDGRNLGSAVVTAVFETGPSNDVTFICRNSPRLLDAMVQAFYDKPIDIDPQRRLDFGNLDTTIKDRANKTLGRDVVSRVYLFSGAKPSDGNLLDKLPFTSVLGCRGTDEEKKKEKEKQQGGGGHS